MSYQILYSKPLDMIIDMFFRQIVAQNEQRGRHGANLEIRQERSYSLSNWYVMFLIALR